MQRCMGVTRNLIMRYLHTFDWTAANTILCVYTDIFLRTVYVVNMTLLGWRRGVVASVVRRMNEVTLRRARLVLGWVTVFGRVYHHAV